jgi:para-nitrobenzyl esterase
VPHTPAVTPGGNNIGAMIGPLILKAIDEVHFMQSHLIRKFILLSLLATLLAACSQSGDPQKATADASEPSAPAAESLATAEAVSELDGTSWQLVQIMSMDDRTFVAEDRSLYTLAFGTDGTLGILADCNRGSASWTSTPDNQLQFGPIAATMAMCPPGSLHDTYMAQLEWVRSYTMRDGHLFLATMADGAIIEFEPAIGN